MRIVAEYVPNPEKGYSDSNPDIRVTYPRSKSQAAVQVADLLTAVDNGTVRRFAVVATGVDRPSDVFVEEV